MFFGINFAIISGWSVKGSVLEFLESRRTWENQNLLENYQESWLFWASPSTATQFALEPQAKSANKKHYKHKLSSQN